MLNEINGWLNLDKPAGVTSNYINTLLKRKLGIKKRGVKIGFTGTLDPFATGLLTFAIGHATKCLEFLTNNTKAYDFSVIWGEHRDTYDKDGAVLDVTSNIPKMQKIQRVIPQFLGETLQMPPPFSAIKIRGKRACDRVRRGESVTPTAKAVFIKSLEITEHSGLCTKFKIVCQKGCYVRSLAVDMAKSLRSSCYVDTLRRTADGFFSVDDAISVEILEKMSYNDIVSCVVPTDKVLDDIPAICFGNLDIEKFCHGAFIPIAQYDKKLVRVYNNDSSLFVGFATIKDGMCYSKKVFL